MDSRMWCFILALQMVSCCFISVTSRPFTSNHHDDLVHNSLNQTVTGKRGEEGVLESGGDSEMEEYSKGLSKIGSSPPSCEHKCFGCSPCEAIQVPTISKNHKHLGVQYTNYEPEGWKCKCGSSFYSP
ncbi:EPIDERMAL PATTERNING FACTOR-like protein 2 [Euphorbia lathyris]|uniref:EPIDERMAL PATTERNING FACTOR-like protein 2 n=1 Tax=Euphorbia lathyris TaxID=212925 RepID=UPI00331363CF